MATYFRMFDVARRFLDANGDPLNGGQVFIYAAGSSTKSTVYKDNAGGTSHANPIVLDSGGQMDADVWALTGSYKVIITDSSDTDPPASGETRDNITLINDTSTDPSTEWIDSGLTPTYSSGTQFTLAGDQTAEFHVGRRVQWTDSGGSGQGVITASSYSSSTTVTVRGDGGDTIDSGLSAIAYGLLSADTPSYTPSTLEAVTATTSGRSAAYTGIESWVKKIEIGIAGLSTNGTTDLPMIQIGDSGGYETSSYIGSVVNDSGGTTATLSAGFTMLAGTAAAATWSGNAVLNLIDPANNIWTFSSSLSRGDSAAAHFCNGYKALSGTLDRVKLQLTGSTDDLDAGNINITKS